MTDLDTLRPEVREAVERVDDGGVMGFALDCWRVVRAELLRLTNEVAILDASESQLIDERDHAQDALHCTHIELGGDGEWTCTMGAAAEYPPDSGDLHLDVPALASEVRARAEKAEAELAEMKQSFDLRWKADMRAIEQWRAAHPGKELTWPDHADLCMWLMGELAALKAKFAGAKPVYMSGFRVLTESRDELELARAAWIDGTRLVHLVVEE